MSLPCAHGRVGPCDTCILMDAYKSMIEEQQRIKRPGCTCGNCDTCIDALLARPAEPVEPPTPAKPLAEFSEPLIAALRDENYTHLRRILGDALVQSACGKGKERHNVRGLPFDEQQIVETGLAFGDNHYQLGQADKKIRESVKLPKQRATHELLGAIVYLAAAIRVLELLDEEEIAK